MGTRRRRAAAAPAHGGRGERTTERELAVLEGGGWDGRWYWRTDLEASQRAAERMGHPVTIAGPGELRGYAPTDRWTEHPADGHDRGRVWTWHPERIEQVERDLDEAWPTVVVPAPRTPGDDVDDIEDQGDERLGGEGEGGEQVAVESTRAGGGDAPMPVGELLDGVLRRARVLVCGSRRWVDVATVRRELAAAWSECSTTVGAPVLVHGSCPRGADRIADMLWRRWGGAVETHPAGWDTRGRGAGYRRNAEMVALGADRVLGFVLDASPGSTHTLELATIAGLDVCAHRMSSRATSRAAHPPLNRPNTLTHMCQDR